MEGETILKNLKELKNSHFQLEIPVLNKSVLYSSIALMLGIIIVFVPLMFIQIHLEPSYIESGSLTPRSSEEYKNDESISKVTPRRFYFEISVVSLVIAAVAFWYKRKTLQVKGSSIDVNLTLSCS